MQVIFKKKKPFQSILLSAKLGRKEDFFLGFYFLFLLPLLWLLRPFRKNRVLKICFPSALLEGCTGCVLFPAQFGALICRSTFFSTAAAAAQPLFQRQTVAFGRVTALAPGTVEPSLVCHCCKKPVTPGSLLPLKLEFGRSLGNLPCFTRWYQMQGTC